jgi:hypothetical protein
MLDKLRSMWEAYRWGQKLTEQDVAGLEAMLQGALLPVAPRPPYVRELRRRLVSFPAPAPKDPLSKKFQYTFLGVASVLSGTVLVILGIRVVSALLSGLGSIAHLRRHV